MTAVPSYVAALAVERRGHPDRKLAIDAELVRMGWYVNDDGLPEQMNAQPVVERADADPAPENTAQPATPARSSRKPSTDTDADEGTDEDAADK